MKKTLVLFSLLGCLLAGGAMGQSVDWLRQGSATTSAGASVALGTATDASGNVYVVGHFTGSVAFGTTTLVSAGSYDIFLAKYDATGALQWAKRAGGTGDDIGSGVAVSGTEVYITGYFQGTANFNTPSATGSNQLVSAGSYDIFLAKYDATGALQWAKRAGGTGTDAGYDVAVSGTAVYLTGIFDGTANFPSSTGSNVLVSAGITDIFLAKYDATGALQWAKRAGGAGDDYGSGVAVSGTEVYLTGSFQDAASFPSATGSNELVSAGLLDIFLAKYDDTGALQWAKRAGGTGGDIGSGVAVSGTEVYITGYFAGTANFPSSTGSNQLVSAGGSDIFLAKYDATGALQWAKRAGGTGTDAGYGVAVSGTAVYLTGSFAGTANFNTPSSTGSNQLVSAGGNDIFLAKYDATGALQWAKRAGGTGTDDGYGVAVSGTAVYLTGNFTGTANFNTPSATGSNKLTTISTSGGDAFLAKYSEAATTTLTLGTASNPSTCSGTGSIAFTSTGIAAGSQTLSYTRNGETPALTQTVTIANDGSFTLSNLTDGVYSNFAIGATTATGSRTLTLPASCYFITRWDLSKSTGSGGTQIRFGVGTTGTVNYTWAQVGGGGATGAGTFSGSTATITGLPSGGIIDLSISPTNFNRFNMNDGTDKARLTQIKQWSTTAWASMEGAFYGCSNMTLTATDVPNTAAVTDMSSMFESCSSFNQALPAGFNTANVTNMEAMFFDCISYNQALPASFNTEKVTNMSGMFYNCSIYNQVLPASFNTVEVTNMSGMFRGCTIYDKALPESFNTAKVTNMNRMFEYCLAYNQALPASFNTEKVTGMNGMFSGCSAYNQALPASFNTVEVTDMSGMFAGCTAYNQALPASFNTEKVTDMSGMFGGCTSYDKALPASFNTAAVTNMEGMFYGCTAYNQALPASFNTAAVTNMGYMFFGATAFNQSLAGLQLNANVNLEGFLDNTALSVANYDATLSSFKAQAQANNITDRIMGAAGLQYCAAEADKITLEKSIAQGGLGWTITDGGKSSPCVAATLTVSTSPLNPFAACAGTASAEQSFTVSGSGLTANISVTAPTGFEVSTSSASGFVSSVTLTQSGGAVATTTVYVRMAATATGTPSGNVTVASTNATNKTVAVSGTVNALPTLTRGTVAAICAGATSFTIPYTNPTETPTTYSISGTGITPVTDALLGSSPITVALSAAATTSTPPSYSLTVKNANGCTSTAYTGTVTVNALPAIQLGTVPAICAGAMSFTIPFTGSTETPTTYSISGTGITPVTDGTLPTSPITVNLSAAATTSTPPSYSLTVKNANGCVSTAYTGTVTVNALPTLTTGTISAICAGATSFTIPFTGSTETPTTYSITGTGITPVTDATLGSSPIMVSLSAAATTSTPPSYSLTVKNAAGCVSTAYTGTVTVNALPTLTTGTISAICAGATSFTIPYTNPTETPTTYSITGTGITPATDATLGSSPITVNLSTAATTSTPPSYSLTVKNAAGCISTAYTGTVTVNALPTFTVGTAVKPSSCTATDGSLPLTGLTANTSYSVSYQKDGATAVVQTLSSNASGVLTIPSLGVGSYTNIKVTAPNNCESATATATVAAPTFTLTAVTPPTHPTTCGGTGSIRFTTTLPGGSYTITFKKGGVDQTGIPVTVSSPMRVSAGAFSPNSFTLSGITAGTYTDFKIMYNGCEVTATGPVELTDPAKPTLTIGTISAICVGATSFRIPYSGATGLPTTYSVSGTGITTATNETLVSNFITVSLSTAAVAGTIPYSLTVKNAGGCESSAYTGSVTVNAPPTAFDVTGGGPYCSGGVAIGLSGSEMGVTYQLRETVTGSQSAPVSGTGSAISFGNKTAPQNTPFTYTVVATRTAGGCTATMTGSKSVTNIGEISVTIAGLSTICAGGQQTTQALVTNPSGLTGTWQSSNSDVATVSPTGSVVGVSGGTATFTFTETSAGCVSSPTSPVTVNVCTSLTLGMPTNPTTCGGSDGKIAFTTTGFTGSQTLSYKKDGMLVTPGASINIVSNAFELTGLGQGVYSDFAIGATTAMGSRTLNDPSFTMTAGSPTNPTTCGGTGSIRFTTTLPGGTYTITFKKGGVPQMDREVMVSGPQRVSAGATSSRSFTLSGITAGIYTDFKIMYNGCEVTAAGPVELIGQPLPTAFTVTGGGSFCAGGTGVVVGLSNSETGISYQLKKDNVNVGAALAGTGVAISFGNQTAAGLYTVEASPTPSSGASVAVPSPINCTVTMTGSARVTVNPVPDVATVSNQTFCNNASTTAIAFSGAVGGTVYSWSNNTPSIGLATSGTGNIAAFMATNAGTSPVTATITVTPAYTNGGVTCTGTPTSFTITVNPTPTVNAVSNQTLCNAASSTAMSFSSPTTGGTVVYNWSNNTPSIGLAASGTGNIAAFTATNAGTSPMTATLTVTPAYTNGGVTCTGTPTSFTITVNPSPMVNAVSNQTLCNVASTTAVSFSSPTTGGTVVYSWSNNTPSIGLAASGTGNIAAFTATNAGTSPVTATITVTPAYTNGGATCTGTPTSFTITVNPSPTAGISGEIAVCQNAPFPNVTFTGSGAIKPYTFTYKINNGDNLTVATTGGNTSVTVAQTTAVANTFTYTLVSVKDANGCEQNQNGSAIITVHALPVVSTPQTSLCTGLSMTLSPTSGGTWQSSNPSIASVTDEGLVKGLLAGVVSFTFTQTSTGCSAATTSVTIKPTPTSSLSASQYDVCANTPVSLTPNCSIPTSTVNWNPGGPTVTPAGATLPYVYRARCVAEGCVGNESEVEIRTHRILVDMKDLDVGALPKGIVRSVKDNMEPTNQINAPVFPRRWTFIANGCDASESAVFKLSGPVNFNTIDNAATYAMFANDASGFYSIDHPNYGNGGSFPDGTYSLTIDLRSQDGVGGPFPKNRVARGALLATRTLQFTVQSPQSLVGSRQAAVDKVWTVDSGPWTEISPNPVSNTMRLKVSEAKGQKVSVSLIDAVGRTMLQRSFVPETNQHQEEFEVSNVTSGMYFLKVSTTDKQATLKVVKVGQ